eukprot:m.95908 g.95908  ORF g.95908 m.95908 type:complete len:936 (+) comp10130_c0_seq3:364-3171(+)
MTTVGWVMDVVRRTPPVGALIMVGGPLMGLAWQYGPDVLGRAVRWPLALVVGEQGGGGTWLEGAATATSGVETFVFALRWLIAGMLLGCALTLGIVVYIVVDVGLLKAIRQHGQPRNPSEESADNKLIHDRIADALDPDEEQGLRIGLLRAGSGAGSAAAVQDDDVCDAEGGDLNQDAIPAVQALARASSSPDIRAAAAAATGQLNAVSAAARQGSESAGPGTPANESDDEDTGGGTAVSRSVSGMLSDFIGEGSVHHYEDVGWVNMVLRFFWGQFKSSVEWERFLRGEIDHDLTWLRDNTVAWAVVERMSVDTIDLGTTFPLFSGVSCAPHRGGRFDATFEADVTFQGEASVGLKLDLLRGRHGTVSVRVTKLAGRLQFRLRAFPYPHYTVSFVKEPMLSLQSKSFFEGSEMPHFDTVLVHLIRRAIAKKHTLPTTKTRYEPLFKTPEERREARRPVIELSGRPLHEGRMTVHIETATLYDGVRSGSRCFATLHTQSFATSPLPATGSMKDALELRITLFRDDSTQPLGLVLDQCNFGPESSCRIAAIQPHTVAAASDLAIGDVVTHLDGVPVHTARQAVRALRLVAKSVEFVVLRQAPHRGGESSSAASVGGGMGVGMGTTTSTASTGGWDTTSQPAAGAGAIASTTTWRSGSQANPMPSTASLLDGDDDDNLGPAFLTGMAEGGETMHWMDRIDMTVAARRGLLRIRFFDQRVKGAPKAPKAKPLLVGTADIALDEVALVCLLEKRPCRRHYPLRASDDAGSPIVGKATVSIDHVNEPAYLRDVNSVTSPLEHTHSLPPGFTFDTNPGNASSSRYSNDQVVKGRGARSTDSVPAGVATAGATKPTHVRAGSSARAARAGGVSPGGGAVDVATQVTAIQTFIDLEQETRMDLEKQLENATRGPDRTRLKANIRFSDDRMQLLVAQMLELKGVE